MEASGKPGCDDIELWQNSRMLAFYSNQVAIVKVEDCANND
jgi:hypothetical protein